MKHIILKISFCFSVIFTTAQNKTVTTEVTYKLDFNLNSVSEKLRNKYNSKQLELLQNNYNNYNSLSYKLIFNSKESIFFLVDSVVGVLKDYDESYLEKQKIIKTQSKKSIIEI